MRGVDRWIENVYRIMTTRRLRIVALSAGLAMLAACAGAGETGSGEQVPETADAAGDPDGGVDAETAEEDGGSLADLVAAAEEEGELTLYGNRSPATMERTVSAFEEEYDISVSWERMGTGDLQARFAAEAEAGGSPADLLILSYGDDFPQDMIDAGLAVDPKSVDLPEVDIPDDLYRDGSLIAGAVRQAFVINTDLVDEADEPTDWAELADPRWNDEIIVPDPDSAPGYIMVWVAIWDKYGDDVVRGIGENILREAPSLAPAMEALAAGEASIAVPGQYAFTLPLLEEGAPLKFIETEWSPMNQDAIVVPADPIHPNAQRLFMQWLMTPSGQVALNNPDWFRASELTGEGMPPDYTIGTRDALSRQDELAEIMGRS